MTTTCYSNLLQALEGLIMSDVEVRNLFQTHSLALGTPFRLPEPLQTLQGCKCDGTYITPRDRRVDLSLLGFLWHDCDVELKKRLQKAVNQVVHRPTLTLR